MTLHEISVRYGSSDIANKIKLSKEADPDIAASQIRDHPDAPGVPAACVAPTILLLNKYIASSGTETIPRVGCGCRGDNRGFGHNIVV